MKKSYRKYLGFLLAALLLMTSVISDAPVLMAKDAEPSTETTEEKSETGDLPADSDSSQGNSVVLKETGLTISYEAEEGTFPEGAALKVQEIAPPKASEEPSSTVNRSG